MQFGSCVFISPSHLAPHEHILQKSLVEPQPHRGWDGEMLLQLLGKVFAERQVASEEVMEITGGHAEAAGKVICGYASLAQLLTQYFARVNSHVGSQSFVVEHLCVVSHFDSGYCSLIPKFCHM